MPPVIGAVAVYAVSAAIGSTILGSALLATALKLVVSLAISATVSSMTSKKKSGGAAPADFSRDRTVTIKQPIAPWRVIYGQCRVGGVFTYVKSMNNNQNLVILTTLSGHAVDGLDELLFDDQTVPFTYDGDGIFTVSGRYATTQLYFGNGSADPLDPLDTAIHNALNTHTGGEWTSLHRQIGRAKLYMRLTYSVDTFPNGVPNITAVLRGKKVYDPRTAATAWHHNPALCLSDYLTSTAYGLGATYATEIDEDSLIAAANICDEIVAVVESTDTFTADASTNIITRATFNARCDTGDQVQVSSSTTLPAGLSAATNYYYIRVNRLTGKLATSYANAIAGTAINITDAGTGTHTLTRKGEPRYTCNGTFETDEKPADIIPRLLSAMSGKVVFSGGVWKIYAGAYITPTVTLDESHARKGISANTRVSRRENFNAVKGVFVSPYDNWQPTDFPAVTNATYLSEDNSERTWKDADLTSFTISPSMAQRLAKIELEKARQQISVSYPAKLSAYELEPPNTVMLDNTRRGWDGKVFEVVRGDLISETDKQDAPILGYDLYLRETASTVYDWNNGEETTVDPAPNSGLPDPFTVEPPGLVTVTEDIYVTRDGAGVKASAIIEWSASIDGFLRDYQAEYKLSAASTWTSLPKTPDLTQTVFDILPGQYDFRVKAINELGVSSSYSTSSNQQITGLLAAPADVTGLNIQAVSSVAILNWTEHPDLDVKIGGKIAFRHSPSLTGATWPASTSIGDAIPGKASMAAIPLKEGTYLCKAVDSSGVESTNAASVSSKAATVLTFTTLSTLTEGTGFTGTKANCQVTSGVLELTSVASGGTYSFAAGMDLTTVKKVHLSSRMVATTVNTLDLIDSRTALIDDWVDFDGASVAASDAYVEVRETDNHPGTGSPTWSAWKRLDAADYIARGLQYRAILSVDDPAYNINISELSVTADEVV